MEEHESPGASKQVLYWQQISDCVAVGLYGLDLAMLLYLLGLCTEASGKKGNNLLRLCRITAPVLSNFM